MPDMNEAAQRAMRQGMTSLLPKFERAATKYFDHIFDNSWGPAQYRDQYLVERRSSFPRIKELLRILNRVSELPASSQTAVGLVHKMMHYVIPKEWQRYDELYHPQLDLPVLFDEALLPLCKKLKEDHGVQSLRAWRSKLTEKDIVVIEHRWEQELVEWSCEPFLVHTLQYMTDNCVRDTLQLVVRKVTEGRVPQELADIILDCALAGHDVDDDVDEDPSPAPLIDGWFTFVQQSMSRYSCCPQLRSYHPEQRTFWSSSERRYATFHLTLPFLSTSACITWSNVIRTPQGLFDLSGNSVYVDDEAFRLQNGTVVHDAQLYVRCLKERGDGRKRPNHTIVENGPFPPVGLSGGWHRHAHFEVDHGVGRDWVVKNIEPQK